MQKIKVKFVQVTLAQRCMCQGKGRDHSHMAAVDTKHRIWERFSDMPEGQWGLVEAPDDPPAAGKTPSPKR